MKPFWTRGDEHFIEAGRAYCPLQRRDVDIDLCAGCRWITSVDLKATQPILRCNPPALPFTYVPADR